MLELGHWLELIQPGGLIITMVDLEPKLILGVFGLLIAGVDEFLINTTDFYFSGVMRHAETSPAS